MTAAQLRDQKMMEELFSGDEGEYAYLFPYRDSVPRVEKTIFDDVRFGQEPVDKFVVRTMLNADYIAWTAKTILGINLMPMQIAILQTLWTKPFPMLVASRGAGKSFILGVYCCLRALLEPGTRIVIVGAGLRQAKLVFNYIEDIWNAAPIFRSVVGGGKKAGPKQTVDLCYFRVGTSLIMALPLGDGTKIRGFRANVVIADEFASIPEAIFDIVVRGFTATSKSPIDEAKRVAKLKRAQKMNLPKDLQEAISGQRVRGNQIVYSGTAYYGFNHFAKRWQMWKKIVASRGRPEKVRDIFGGESNIPENFDYRDYAIIRLPYTHVQEGLMDARQLAHAKAVLPRNIFLMEYGACFVRDSDGFFARSLIESCTAYPDQAIPTPDGPVVFTPLMKGVKGRTYVIGIDPAAERDNLAVTVIEIWPNHFRVVYCWAVNKSEFERRKKQGLVTSDDYYAYCCSRIRQTIRAFSPLRVIMDSQGGGYAIAEMLRNRKLITEGSGEQPIYEIIEFEEPKPTDSETDGPHILQLIAQTNEWNSQSNLFMHKSFETKRLLFPGMDTVKMQAALEIEKANNVTFDTYEDNVANIEELKNELCQIQMSETATGKEHFDTPSVIEPGMAEQKKKTRRLRKDRYTSLLLAHRFVYDNDTAPEVGIDYEDVAGNVQAVKDVDPAEGMYRGPGVGQMRNAEWARMDCTGAVKAGERCRSRV